jgi:hypothetical protein
MCTLPWLQTVCLGTWNPRVVSVPICYTLNSAKDPSYSSLTSFGRQTFPWRSRSSLAGVARSSPVECPNYEAHGSFKWAVRPLWTPEDIHHILFNYALARFMWSVVRSMMGVTWNPTSTLEFLEILQSFTGEMKCFLWLYFAIQSWGLWLIRNKFTIESKFPRQPADYVFKCVIVLHNWRPLLWPKARMLADEMLCLLGKAFAENYSHPAPRTSGDANVGS